MNRLIKTGILLVQVALLGGIGTYVAYYLQTREPVMALPVVKAVARTVAPHYLFSIYDVAQPRDVAISPDGQRIYAPETAGENQIRVFDRQGRQLQTISPPPSERLPLPMFIAVGPDGTIYVSDRSRIEVSIFSPDGNYLGAYKTQDYEKGLSPAGLAVTGNGDLVVADTENERILVIGRNGSVKLQSKIKRIADTDRVYPTDLAVDKKGRIYVGNLLGGRLDVFDDKLNQLAAIDGKVGVTGVVQGATVDDDDRVYAVDTLNGTIAVIDISAQNPKPLFSFGGFGVGDGQFRFPVGLAVDAGGRIYIADRVNNRVQVWSY